MQSNINITVNSAPGDESVKIVNLSGELDTITLPVFQKEIEPYIAMESNRHFIFNLKDLEFIGSKGIGYIVYLYTTLSHSNRNMSIVEAGPAVMDILSIVGMDKMMHFHKTLGEALKLATV